MQLIPAIDLKAAAACACCRGTSTPKRATTATPGIALRALRRRSAPTGCTSSISTAPATARRRTLRAHRGARRPRAPASCRSAAACATAATLERAAAPPAPAASSSAASPSPTPDLVGGWLRELGAERLVLALDVRLDADGMPRVATHGWRDSRDSRSGTPSRAITALGPAATCCAPTSPATARSPAPTSRCTATRSRRYPDDRLAGLGRCARCARPVGAGRPRASPRRSAAAPCSRSA